MKRNDIKEMIRQSILAEFNINEDTNIETGNPDPKLKDLYDPLKEDITDEIKQAIKSKRIDPTAVKAAAEKALRGDPTELAVLMATGTNFAKLEEAEEEEISDEETVDIEAPAPDVPADMPADTTMVAEPTYTPEEAALMSDLDDALKKSQDIGDEKLATLIGNIITYFTRQHVVKEGEAGRKKHYKGAVKDDEDQISKLKKDMKFDKKQLKTESLEILKMKKLAGLLTEGEYAKALLNEEVANVDNFTKAHAEIIKTYHNKKDPTSLDNFDDGEDTRNLEKYINISKSRDRQRFTDLLTLLKNEPNSEKTKNAFSSFMGGFMSWMIANKKQLSLRSNNKSNPETFKIYKSWNDYVTSDEMRGRV